MSSNTPKVRNPSSYANRQAANVAGKREGCVGDFCRRIAYRKGWSVLIIDTARKTAFIIYKMLETGEAYSCEYAENESKKIKKTAN